LVGSRGIKDNSRLLRVGRLFGVAQDNSGFSNKNFARAHIC
jgi:hypothetical protein